MTPSSQHTAWLKFHVFQAKIEKKYTPVLKKEISIQITTFNTYAAGSGFPQAASKINDIIKPEPILTIVNDIHKECAGKWGSYIYNQFKNIKHRQATVAHKAEYALTQLKHPTYYQHHIDCSFHVKRVALFGVSADIAAQIIQELRLSLLNNVHGITDSIKEDILYYVQQGQINGWAYDKTAKEIQDKVGSAYRSQRIVRTESVKASNMGGIEGARRTGLLMDKVWINAKDKRVRGNPQAPISQFDHWDIGGVTIPLNQPFLLGSRTGASDSMQFPGDPNGNPGDIINCRCTLGFIPKRDENGVPIRIAPRVLASNN